MGKKSNLTHEMKRNLQKQTRFGESKHKIKQEAREKSFQNKEPYQQVKGFFSYNTLKTYDKAGKHFINYTLKHHREVRNLNDCKNYISEYLEDMENNKLSAWTIHMRGCALASIYNCDKKDFGYSFPERKRADIIRSRSYTKSENRVENARFNKIKDFCRGTGARRSGLSRLCKEDVRCQNGQLQISLTEKNGMQRWSRVLPLYEELVSAVINESPGYQGTGGRLHVFHRKDLPTSLTIHKYRAEYAQNLYLQFEKEEHATGELYHCRKDRAGEVYDKGILRLVSENLGHHRCDVVVSHYL